MPKPDSPRNRRAREAERARAAQAAREEAARRAARRRGLIGIGVVVGVVLAVIGVIRAATAEREREQAGPATSAPSTTAGPAVSLPTPAPGASVEGTAACPPADGADERITAFSSPPPDCLDPAIDYEADLRTSKGPITVDLTEDGHRDAVNTFVFLARYGYYDGLPFTTIRRAAFAQVADPPNEDGSPGPGFRQPATGASNDGTPSAALTSLFVGFTPEGGTTGGGLTIGMPGDQYTTIPPDSTPLGIVLDARPDRSPEAPDDQRTVLQLINDAASPSGAPTEVITIEGVDIRELPRR